MQRFYGLNLDRMGIDYTPSHAAACVACLPPSSALLAKATGYSLLLSDVPVELLLGAFGAEEEQREVQPMTIQEYEAAMAAYTDRGHHGI